MCGGERGYCVERNSALQETATHSAQFSTIKFSSPMTTDDSTTWSASGCEIGTNPWNAFAGWCGAAKISGGEGRSLHCSRVKNEWNSTLLRWATQLADWNNASQTGGFRTFSIFREKCYGDMLDLCCVIYLYVDVCVCVCRSFWFTKVCAILCWWQSSVLGKIELQRKMLLNQLHSVWFGKIWKWRPPKEYEAFTSVFIYLNHYYVHTLNIYIYIINNSMVANCWDVSVSKILK